MEVPNPFCNAAAHLVGSLLLDFELVIPVIGKLSKSPAFSHQLTKSVRIRWTIGCGRLRVCMRACLLKHMQVCPSPLACACVRTHCSLSFSSLSLSFLSATCCDRASLSTCGDAGFPRFQRLGNSSAQASPVCPHCASAHFSTVHKAAGSHPNRPELGIQHTPEPLWLLIGNLHLRDRVQAVAKGVFAGLHV